MGSDWASVRLGDNTYGPLGNGTSVTFSDTPVLVWSPTGRDSRRRQRRVTNPPTPSVRTGTSMPGATISTVSSATVVRRNSDTPVDGLAPLGGDTTGDRRGWWNGIRHWFGREICMPGA